MVPHGFHLHEGQGDLQVLDNRVQSLTVIRDPVSEEARREVAADRAVELLQHLRDALAPSANSIDHRRAGQALGHRVERQSHAHLLDLSGNLAGRFQILVRFLRGRNVELALHRLAEADATRPPRLYRPRGPLQNCECLRGGQLVARRYSDRSTFPRVVAFAIGEHSWPQ